jgi:hypothetical protein
MIGMKDSKILIQSTVKMKIAKYKIMLSMFSLMLIVSSCFKQAEPEMHLIPKGYKGPVIIVFGDREGKPVKYEDGKRVYEISSDGVLRTQFKKQQGSIAPGELKYYYYYGKGREEIDYLQSIQGVNDSAIYVFSKELSNSTVRYLVGKLSEGDSYYNALRKRIDELFPPRVQ